MTKLEKLERVLLVGQSHGLKVQVPYRDEPDKYNVFTLESGDYDPDTKKLLNEWSLEEVKPLLRDINEITGEEKSLLSDMEMDISEDENWNLKFFSRYIDMLDSRAIDCRGLIKDELAIKVSSDVYPFTESMIDEWINDEE